MTERRAQWRKILAKILSIRRYWIRTEQHHEHYERRLRYIRGSIKELLDIVESEIEKAKENE